jgi:hypothetical protein
MEVGSDELFRFKAFALQVIELQLSISCRILDIFLYRYLGGNPLNTPFHKKISRKLMLFYEQASVLEREEILKQFPELCETTRNLNVSKISRTCQNDTFNTSQSIGSDFVSLAKSEIWLLQNSYYSAKKIEAWSMVPYEISSNAFVGQLYCNKIEALVFQGRLTSDIRRVCIIEIAAGHGILSILIARELKQVRNFCIYYV